MKKRYNIYIIKLFFIVLGCSTFYSTTRRFTKNFENCEFEKAQEVLLENSENEQKGKNRLLFFLNNGVVSHLLGNFEQSNIYFEKAYQTFSNFTDDYLIDTLSFIINPTISDYRGEDHVILLLYYKALNYLFLGDMPAALVACQRMNKELRKLKAKYKSQALYSKDPFIHLLMGIIFQANHEFNDAFIAYRNAVDIYISEYNQNYNMVIPNQLKLDLLAAAYKMRFYDELHKYEKIFNLKYKHIKYKNHGDLIIFWNNGLCPIKSENTLSFAVSPGIGGVVNFSNDKHGMMFPFPIPTNSNNIDLTKLSLLKVPFPKYVERKLFYNYGEVVFNNKTYPLELCEDLNAICFKTLKQRMVWELSKTLIRIAIKKLTEYALSKQNKYLGLAAGIFNFYTETTDTRCWLTAPHSIFYARIKMKAGEQKFSINILNKKSNFNKKVDLIVNIRNNKTNFYELNSVEYTT